MLKRTGKSEMTVNQGHFFRRSILLLFRTRLVVSVLIMGREIVPGITKVKCYNCDSYGHYSNSCPKPKRNKSGGKSDNKPAQFANEVNDGLEKYEFTGKLNGKSVTMLRDTGASKIYVHPGFVSKADYTGKVSITSLANSTKQEAPLALAHLNVDGQTFDNVKVAVMNTPFPVLLGNEFENIGGTALVVTRNRAKEIQKEEDRAKSEQNITKVVPSPIDGSKKLSIDMLCYAAC